LGDLNINHRHSRVVHVNVIAREPITSEPITSTLTDKYKTKLLKQ